MAIITGTILLAGKALALAAKGGALLSKGAAVVGKGAAAGGKALGGAAKVAGKKTISAAKVTGKKAVGSVKSRTKKIAKDKLLGRGKKKGKRFQRPKREGAEQKQQQEKGGELAVRPTTSLVPTGPGAIVSSPGGDLPTTGDSGGGGSAYELATSISTKIIRVEKLLKGSALIKKDLRDDLRKQAKIDEDKLQEKALEKQKVKSKTKFKIPGTEAAKGILSKVFNFFSTVGYQN
jgi:hypothetical protein